MYFWDLDKMVPLNVGNKMAEKIKNTEVKIIKNCGHMIILKELLKCESQFWSF